MITHEHPEYIKRRKELDGGKYNGCYYYSKEIVKNIIPNVKTWRDWNTVGRECEGMCDGMIVFLHDNSTPWHYNWLKNYKDLILVCSSKYTADSVKYFGTTVLLPMSIDTDYVKQFRTEKTKDTCFAGNIWVKDNIRSVAYISADITGKIDFFSSMPREKLLKEIAKYKKCLAIDRCAQEAITLGCELLPLETRYHCDNFNVVVDNKEAAKMLQAELDKIDGGNHESRKTDNEEGG